jgi:hypothetical protein
MGGSQRHLSHKEQVDLGSFYTPEKIVNLTYSILEKNVPKLKDATILDSSCGYGSFLKKNASKKMVGADIDVLALRAAEAASADVSFYETNSLKDVSRTKYRIDDKETLVAIGNPPYNDTTSIIRQDIKDKSVQNEIDPDIKTRDLGMSFMLSYDKLQADYVCILHPLSYLIKKANFTLLGKFARNYKLIDSMIISSHEFSDTSRGMAFPILIGLYKREKGGMSYDFIRNYHFATKERTEFCMSDFDTIANYISKYPNKQYISDTNKPVAKFYTMRDINALKRSRTFIDNDMTNTVYVVLDKLPYYCYVDVFKKYADKLPYYLGNCDIMIDKEEFEKIKECFVAESVHNNPILKNRFKIREIPQATLKIEEYFDKLLGEHIHATNYS